MIDPSSLAAIQHFDGGWGYNRDASAVEPTALALLALTACELDRSEPFSRGAAWLSRLQRADGGWPPRPAIAQSTWVTSLVLLVPHALPGAARRSAENWLVSQTGRESSWLERLRGALATGSLGQKRVSDGWPWFPGAAAWTVPTAMGVLALERLDRSAASQTLQRRIQSGRDFLFARRCLDGGWNHGANEALGYPAASYGETTGVALLALTGARAATLAPSFVAAEKHLATTRSREAAAWLQLGLLAHDRRPVRREFEREPSTAPAIALAILADCALEGRSVFA